MVEQRDECIRNLQRNVLQSLSSILGCILAKPSCAPAYGIDDMDQNDDYSSATQIPLLRYVPEWVPGAGFKKTFKRIVEITETALTVPYEAAKASRNQGKGSVHPSMASSLIDDLPDEGSPNRPQMEELGKHVCATAYIAGADTSVASATAFILAMATHPNVQKKAQAEIDTVIGPNRLPLIKDRLSLPYLQAILKEVGRWYTVGPLAFPHATNADDEYEGYFIPKGTCVIANSWAIMHDEDLFERPFDFMPERYMRDGKIDPSVPGPEVAAFGFGRRICPGRHFSDDTIFLLAASILANFNISPPRDEAGNPVELKLVEASSI
ncbi:hypothetical protein NMY22_g18719 [Coprinellus aureogranulatus]|nr:hypothetical protein NMY22_g18719 [Coprinellus aureogranulatus]